MNTRMIIAALLGTVISFLLGWVVFGMLLDPYYQANVVHYHGLMRTGDDMRLYGIFLSQLCANGLLAYIFSRWANITSFVPGFSAGLIIGFLMYASFDLAMWSSMNIFPAKFFAVDVIVNAVFAGVMGGVIGVILGWGKKAAA